MMTMQTKDGESHAAQVEMVLLGWSPRQPEQINSPPTTLARLPRITRLMALAIKFQDMVDRGEVRATGFLCAAVASGPGWSSVVIRAHGPTAGLAQPARKLIQSIDRDVLVGEPSAMETLVSSSLGSGDFI